jgi:hypothetical protein
MTGRSGLTLMDGGWEGGGSPGDRVDVLWRCPDPLSLEHTAVTTEADGMSITGSAVLAGPDGPSHLVHEITAQGRTRRVVVDVDDPAGRRRLLVERGAEGGWAVDGEARPDLDDVEEVDLSWTPATNTLALRHLDPDVEVGEAGTVVAAWVRHPELDVERVVQTYSREGDDRWRFVSGPYNFVLEVGPGHVVLDYECLWEATHMTITPGPG